MNYKRIDDFDGSNDEKGKMHWTRKLHLQYGVRGMLASSLHMSPPRYEKLSGLTCTRILTDCMRGLKVESAVVI